MKQAEYSAGIHKTPQYFIKARSSTIEGRHRTANETAGSPYPSSISSRSIRITMKHQHQPQQTASIRKRTKSPLGHRTQSGAQTTKDSDPGHIQSNASSCAN
ncbi:hypothetical protein Nepgr_006802 [Nepenthes gracilis]|uniref:Uncharacterized protein n=1 Tax=Nepenthes gracilis TaxID=150966 RepID=A0AAD3XHN6_NEPGR|nr:hypothetical protein Nepgr_006802 [Nepenthes gracilis]